MSHADQSTAASGNGSQPKSHLTLWILLSIVAAIGVALLFPHFASRLKLGGEIVLSLLKMMVVPLVVSSVMSGILGLGDVRRLGRPGGAAVLYYMTTTVLAVAVGLVAVNLIQPGVGTVSRETLQQRSAGLDGPAVRQTLRESLAEESGLSAEDVSRALPQLAPTAHDKPSLGTILHNLVLMLFTDNLFKSAVETQLLPLIVFSIIFAGMLTTLGERVEAITLMIDQVNHALMNFVLLLMNVAPLGIFCLVTARFGEAQAKGEFVEELQQTGWYVFTVLAGLGLHMLVTLPLIYWVFTRKNPYRFIYHMSQALLTAFSTASSSATLPITMECAQRNAGISERSTEFVLPLGATINMDGTALYEAVAAIFIAQAIGFPLGIVAQLTIAVTATLAAIGAAGIPEAGLVTMLIVLNAVGLPLEYIGLILSVDWLLDRFRTAVNVFGDAVGTAVVDGTFPVEAENLPADTAPVSESPDSPASSAGTAESPAVPSSPESAEGATVAETSTAEPEAPPA